MIKTTKKKKDRKRKKEEKQTGQVLKVFPRLRQ
jgi:hypothetical protein